MKYILLFLLALLLFSCFEQGDCSDVSSNVMQWNFYSFSNKKSKKILVDSIIMEGWDTVMYKNDSLTKVLLPLNPATDTMTYHFYYQAKHDTIGLSYDKKSFALAPGCNAIDVINLLTIKSRTLPDAKVKESKLTPSLEEIENIQLYF